MEDDTALADAFARLSRERRSCRAFASRSVPSEVFEAIAADAQRAPSWCNTQPWSVLVTSGTATARFRDGLARYAADVGPRHPEIRMPTTYEGLLRERRRESGRLLYETVGIERDDREGAAEQAARNFDLFGAPHVALVTVERNQYDFGLVDAGVFAAFFMLAAQARGVSTVPQASIAMCAPFVRQFFTVPDTQAIVLGISFGYADDTAPVNAMRTARATSDEVVRIVSE